MIERLTAPLEREGWEIHALLNGWLAAREPSGHWELALRTVHSGETLPSLEATLPTRISDVIVLCPDGVDSMLLRQADTSVQYWFWDLRTGEIFPYPQAEQGPMVDWLQGLLKGEVRPFFARRQDRKNEKKAPFFSYTIIAMNLIMFLLMEIAGGSTKTTVLIAFGAKVNSLIRQGEIWRLLTANFIHIGTMHLAFNLYALWSLGPFAEELFGHRRFLALYIISGIGGTLASYFFSPALSAGASAAIFGLLGALILYSWRHPKLWHSGLGLNLVIVTAVNLMFGLVQSGIDNYAHLGGLFSGVMIAALSEVKAK